MTIPFILASASPARRQLLKTVGIDPVVLPSHFDESQVTTTDPEALVTTLATGKAEVVAQQQRPPALVLGCDSVLELGGEIYGKPQGIEDAIARRSKPFEYLAYAKFEETGADVRSTT